MRYTGSHAVITGNTISAQLQGIYVGHAVQVTISDNTIANSKQVGIQLGPNSVVEVTGNAITGPADHAVDHDGPYGIQVFSGVSGTVSGNRIANHLNLDPERTACGIVIYREAPDVLVADNVFPDLGNEVELCDHRTAMPPATPAATPVP